MVDIEKEIRKDRRKFIKNVLSGTIAGSLLLVIPLQQPGVPGHAGLVCSLPLCSDLRLAHDRSKPG